MKPHYKVYTRLGVSNINGIGVFAIANIPKGTDIFCMDSNSDTVEIHEKDVEKLPGSIKKLYYDFCPLNNHRYTCPKSFAMLTPSWYLNNSENNNVDVDDECNFIANRDIKKGEEITSKYDTYSDKPPGEIV